MKPTPPPGFDLEEDRQGPTPPPGFEVEPARPDQSYIAGLARTGLGQGTLFGLGDEAMALARSIGDETYDDALKDERAKVESFRNENPGTALAAELAGSFATPGLGLAAGAIKPAATVLGKIAQGSKLGAGFGGAYGFASSEGGGGNLLDQAYERGTGALTGAAVGAGLGAALPAASGIIGGTARKVSDFAAPAIARHTKGVDAAADTVMTQRMAEAGDSPQALRAQIEEAKRVGTFYGGGRSASRTDTPLGIADLSPAMQKLAGSASRSSGEANARAEAFIGTRQTGVTPKNAGAAQFADEGGVVHRSPFAPLSREAEPAGQYERVKDALTRSMTLEDKDFHKFGNNAYRTEQAMMKALKTEADKLYGEARTAAQNFNVQPVIRPVVEKYANAVLDMPVGEATLVKRALRQFTTGNGQLVTSLDGFDKAKRVLDGLMGRAQNAGDKNAVRILKGIKDDMVGAVDAVPNQQIGEKYKAARNYFSSQMEMKDAIDLGRQAFKENSDVVADQFRNLSEGQQKLFRLGLIESFEANIGRSKRTNDVTQIFETPRIQDLLRTVVPRTETATGRAKKGAVYADRPERLGDLLANEKAMVKSRDKILGGSQTAERVGDDMKFTRQGLSQMITNLRTGGGVTGVVMEAAAAGLNKIFGMREDVAAEVGRRLFTAKPQEIEAILQRLEQAAPQQAGQFYALLSNMAVAGTAGASGQAGQAAANVQVPEMELQGSTPYRRRFDAAGNPIGP
jgi:hypothetical protein